jgi:hypothetical protein
VVSPSDRPGEDVILDFISSVKPLALLPTDLPIDIASGLPRQWSESRFDRQVR